METTDYLGRGTRNLAPHLVVDGPQIIKIALDSGAAAYTQRYPETQVRTVYSFQAGEPVCELLFSDRSAHCDLGPIFIHARTGELLSRRLNCLP